MYTMKSPSALSGEKVKGHPTLGIIVFHWCRYAQQARNIVNQARVNEDPNVKMIRGEYHSAGE
jgi:hypothetical protein